jgi:hypothetical protein
MPGQVAALEGFIRRSLGVRTASPDVDGSLHAKIEALLEGQPRLVRKTLTFDGTAGLGAVGNVPLFTVTGEVLVVLLSPFCSTLLAGATATLALGVTGKTSLFIAATLATDIDTDEFWYDTTPYANGIAVPSLLRHIAITDNIVGTAAVAAITAGVIRFDCFWIPLSSNGLVVAA